MTSISTENFPNRLLGLMEEWRLEFKIVSYLFVSRFCEISIRLQKN